jgi:hypothetical protein
MKFRFQNLYLIAHEHLYCDKPWTGKAALTPVVSCVAASLSPFLRTLLEELGDKSGIT